ncbi:hypothetical protein [Vibrio gallaecicus]|nr:hypothetical protein [Vibrio gallaecicus]MDN3613768.1 hypothetical protein [Vibrio gallaecicus]
MLFRHKKLDTKKERIGVPFYYLLVIKQTELSVGLLTDAGQ